MLGTTQSVPASILQGHPLVHAQCWVTLLHAWGHFALCWADSNSHSQVQPVACENSEDRSITRVDEGLEDFFAKRLITETLP